MDSEDSDGGPLIVSMGRTMTTERIIPSKALYIKLGRGGIWERECIETEQIHRLGYS